MSGPASVEPPSDVTLDRVRTADEMHRALAHHLGDADCLIMAAAVADYRPRHTAEAKIRRADDMTLELEPTVDILAALASEKGNRLHVGFALETLHGDYDGTPFPEASNELLWIARKV